MIDPKIIHIVEQGLEQVGEILCPYYWKLYQGCQDQGFTKEESMQIITATIQRPDKEPLK